MISVTDANGAAITDSTHIANVNPLRYRGYYYDSETGLYYISARYYDPIVKRMLNSDDELLSAVSPQALTDKNYFAYCDNNPVIRVDRDGGIWGIVLWAVADGLLNSIDEIVELVDVCENGGNKNVAIVNLAISFTTGAAISIVSSVASKPVATIIAAAACYIFTNGYDVYTTYRSSGNTADLGSLVSEASVNVVCDVASTAISSKINKEVTDGMLNEGEKLLKKGTTRARILSKRERTPNVQKGLAHAAKKQSTGKKLIYKAKALSRAIDLSVSRTANRIKNWIMRKWHGKK